MMKGEESYNSPVSTVRLFKHYFSDELSIAGKTTLEEFVADANKALRFQLVRDEKAISQEIGTPDENNRTFPPEMTHQIYGES